MPIEDVDYLLKNSITDTFFFFVDSSKRDKSVFPTPSSYVVTFAEPYTNVYGVEIVTSTMPSTMYNNNNNNRRLVTLAEHTSDHGRQTNSSTEEKGEQV